MKRLGALKKKKKEKKITEDFTNVQHISLLNVHHASMCIYLFDGCIHGKLIGLFLCLTEDNGSPMAATVHLNHVAYHCRTL